MGSRDPGMPTDAAAEAWQVADLTIDVGQQRVLRAGAEIALPKLSFDLLLALVRRAPNVVSSDELMSLVWPGLVVGPETVVQRVKLLRQALGESSSDPRYIGALRGRGYRLLAQARSCGPLPAPGTADANGETPAAANADSSPPPGLPWRVIAAAAVVLLAITAAWLGGRTPRTATETAAAAVEASATLDDTGRTVAVLPFDNLSLDPADAFMALSLPEMTLARLAALRGLTIIARESSFRARESTSDAREIGRRLGAAYLVGGSVQRNGDALRVTARLVDARRDVQLWSRDFDGTVADLFAMQDEIAAQVAAALETQISKVAYTPPVPVRSPSVEAYLAYLRGRAMIGRFTVAEADAAAAEFARAVEIEPTFAAAHAALYDARMQAAGLRHDDLDSARAAHRPILERSLELDPQSGSAWFARAMWEDLEVPEREAAYRKAMSLDPGNTRGLVAFSEFLDITDSASDAGRIVGSGFDPASRAARGAGLERQVGAAAETPGNRAAEAERILQQALRIDPLSPRAHFRRAMREFRRDPYNVEAPILAILELDPDYYPALQRLAKYRAIFHGHPAEAIAVIERAIRNDPENPWAPHTAVAFYLDVGDPAAAAEVAASTPVTKETARPVLALYAGDWRAAGEAAASPRGFEFGFNESWGATEALRDRALRSGGFASAERVMRERYALPATGPVHITLGNYRAAVPLAQLELAQGREAHATEMLHAVIRWIDADVASPPVYKRRTRAAALMLLGERERALQDLEASFLEDHDYNQWWYTLEHDPTWEELRDDARFEELASAVRAYVARERAMVDQMRERGDIPRRGTGRAVHPGSAGS